MSEVVLDEGGNVGQVRPSKSWRDNAGGMGGGDLTQYWYQTCQITNENAFEDARVVVENAGGRMRLAAVAHFTENAVFIH